MLSGFQITVCTTVLTALIGVVHPSRLASYEFKAVSNKTAHTGDWSPFKPYLARQYFSHTMYWDNLIKVLEQNTQPS